MGDQTRERHLPSVQQFLLDSSRCYLPIKTLVPFTVEAVLGKAGYLDGGSDQAKLLLPQNRI
jgi:hypothetical protein